MPVIVKSQIREDVKTFFQLLAKRLVVILNTSFLFYIILDIFNVISTHGNLSFKDFFINPECGKYWILAIIFNILSGYFNPDRFKAIDWFTIVMFWIITLSGFCIVY